jgi:murein DD-endopeptidase MepM/ murein hydrolase activator NlpD
MPEAERLYGSRSSSGGVLERASENIILLQSVIPERSETLDLVGEFVEQADAKPSIWPSRGRLISGFGMRRIPYQSSGYQFHTGVDIVGAHGSDIVATAPGEVVFTGYRGSYGNIVIIDHGYGYETWYAHLTGFAVSSGESVERGQLVGYMGASGRTTGTHLHYEVHFNGSPVNPRNYMNQR